MRQKHDRRLYYRSLQESFTAAQYALWNEALGPNLVESLKGKKGMVAAYQAKAKEANLRAAFSLPLSFCFPTVLSKKEATMEFRHVLAPVDGKQFTLGAYGIAEPNPKNPLVIKSDIQICLVPLLAFDSSGRRLGQGKGFYDRFLAGFTGLKIGVAFEWQFSPQNLPVDQNDQSLDLVVTEHGVRDFRKKARALTL